MQIFVGRVAMIGFASALVGEIQTGGKGPLGQISLPIQTPVNPQVAGTDCYSVAHLATNHIVTRPGMYGAVAVVFCKYRQHRQPGSIDSKAVKVKHCT